MLHELPMRAAELQGPLTSVYFGGGTPSLCSPEQIRQFVDDARLLFGIAPDAEITLEANPDDLSESYLQGIKAAGINRLSIGIQSFTDEDLRMMNRSHHASDALAAVARAKAAGFRSISIDLIYGLPDMTESRWMEHLQQAIALSPTHISAYCLTVESGTALAHFIQKGLLRETDDERSLRHFDRMTERLEEAGFVHYEISNFALPGYDAQHNSAYWTGQPYLGIGPAAHSYNGKERSWNVSNNAHYISGMKSGKPNREIEVLTVANQFNERIMTGLRTRAGVDTLRLRNDFPEAYAMQEQTITAMLQEGLLTLQGHALCITKDNWFRADGIASDLFIDAL